mmetsp:Transcript_19533/g.54424  ORF Transcript_19533/g.54424 Transcript_19533/m.54424 type:complete len:84 (-) Transcript_19533:96-347(-)
MNYTTKRGMTYLLSFGDKPWEALARKLKDQGISSPLLDRLTTKQATLEAHMNMLQREFMQVWHSRPAPHRAATIRFFRRLRGR